MNRNLSELDADTRALLEELSGRLDACATPPAPPSIRESVARHASELLLAKPSAAQSLWHQLRIQARFLPWWYYAASAVLCVVAVMLLRLMPYDDAARIGLVIGMAPLPALLGLLELFHGADEGMGEIESACRYSPARVMSARMLIVGVISACIAAAIGMASGITQGWVAAGVVVVPFCGGSALGLLLSAALRGRASSAQVALAIALTNGVAAAAVNSGIGNHDMALTPVGWVLAMAVSAIALGVAVKTLSSEHSKLMERKLLQWN